MDLSIADRAYYEGRDIRLELNGVMCGAAIRRVDSLGFELRLKSDGPWPEGSTVFLPHMAGMPFQIMK